MQSWHAYGRLQQLTDNSMQTPPITPEIPPKFVSGEEDELELAAEEADHVINELLERVQLYESLLVEDPLSGRSARHQKSC